MTSDPLLQNTTTLVDRQSFSASLNSKKAAAPTSIERPTDATADINGQQKDKEQEGFNTTLPPGIKFADKNSSNDSLQPSSDDSQSQQQAQPVTTISAAELREILDEINSALYSYNRALKFELNDKTEDLVVRVMNTKTDEIIRQYPSEEILAQRARLLEGETHFFSAQVS